MREEGKEGGRERGREGGREGGKKGKGKELESVSLSGNVLSLLVSK